MPRTTQRQSNSECPPAIRAAFRGSRVVVTGAAGFLDSHLSERLVAGLEVIEVEEDLSGTTPGDGTRTHRSQPVPLRGSP
jgi:hypothetical protein